MKNIKTIAGDILLYLYKQQREKAFIATYEILRFGKDNSSVVLSSDTKFSESILRISSRSSADAYNALSYLENGYFITLSKSKNTGGVLINQIHVTDRGIDIIEGIEREQEARRTFSMTFNIKLADTINVESLIKNELGSLLKVSAI